MKYYISTSTGDLVPEDDAMFYSLKRAGLLKEYNKIPRFSFDFHTRKMVFDESGPYCLWNDVVGMGKGDIMIDLRTCKPGQKLRSKHGMILTYVGPLPEDAYYDHRVLYSDGGAGTRTHDGYVFREIGSRLPADHDIVEILPIDEEAK